MLCMWNRHGSVARSYVILSYENYYGMVAVVTGLVGVVTAMVGIVIGMGNCGSRVVRL